MAVLKEFRCLAHGPFDGTEAVCPHGCETVLREFRTAPGTRSHKTKFSDKALERLANRFGLTDMSNRNGSVGNSRTHQENPFAPVWGKMPKGNSFAPGRGEVPVDGAAGGAQAALKDFGSTATTSLAPAMEKLYPGKKYEAEPNFMDIAKTLPRVRPIYDKRMQYGTPQQLDALIKK
jgi:hypothetical protein